MMRTTWLFLTVFLMTLSLATTAKVYAELAGVTKQAIGHVIMTEQVLLPNQVIKTLVIQTAHRNPVGETELVFAVAEKADKMLHELRPGDRVTVEYTDAHGMLTAKAIKKG